MTTYYTTEQIAEMMGLARHSINDHIRRGTLQATKRKHEGHSRYMISAEELTRFLDWWAKKRPDGKPGRWYKSIPTQDEITDFGARISWSSVRVGPSRKGTPQQTTRYVSVVCACGRSNEWDVNDLLRSTFKGLCMPCARRRSQHQGKLHKNWKDGTYLRKDGYRCIHRNALSAEDLSLVSSMIGPTKPYILEHRLVMAKHLGRPLLDKEHVHHKDADKLNNDPSNLELVSPSHHAVVELVMARAEVRRLRELTAVLMVVILQRGG